MPAPVVTALRLGAGLITCQRYPGDPRSDRRLYEEALEFAVAAERFGLDSVYVSEHHFVDDGYLPSVMPLCAAIAARTERIEVGTALLLAPLHDPLRIAEDAAVVDLISGGRLRLGVGLGWREEEFESFAVPLSERVARLVDAIAVLRQAFGDGAVTGTARRPIPGPGVFPKPCRPGGPPIVVGAMREPAVRRAGRLADGLMATEVDPDGLAEQCGWAREELARRDEAPAHPFEISLHVPVFCSEEDDAFAVAADHLRYVNWKYEDMESARGRLGPVTPPPPSGEELLAARAGSIVGNPDEVARAIDAFRRAAGGELHFIARLYLPGLPWELQLASLELFATRAAPLARELAGGTP